MTPARLDYELDADTVVAGSLAAVTSDPGVGRQAAVARRRLVTVAGLLLGSLLALYLIDAPAGIVAGVGAWFTLVLVASNWPGGGPLRRRAAAQVRQVLAEPSGAAVLGRRSLTFTRTGLTIHTRFAREEYDWGGVSAVRRTPDFLVVVLPGFRPLAVPRSAFRDDFEYDRFAEDVQALAHAAGGGL